MMTHVDVFLGVAMVMLGVSLLITIATQIVSFLLNLRGKQLQRGLTELFQNVGIGSPEEVVKQILGHRLIDDGGWPHKGVPAIAKVDVINLLTNIKPYLDRAPYDGKVVTEVENWFDATMARVAHRFTIRTRFITAGAAVLAAVVLHIDSFGLISRLYADSDLRTRMAGAAAGLVSKSESIVAPPSFFTDAASKLGTEFKLPAPEKPPQTRAEVEAWIKGAKPDPEQAKPITTKLDALVDEAIKPQFERWLGDVGKVNAQLAGAGFQLVPSPYDPFHYTGIVDALGVLVSAVLLSLGAPFWFNALKTVSNLRPAIAAAVGDRDQKKQDGS